MTPDMELKTDLTIFGMALLNSYFVFRLLGVKVDEILDKESSLLPFQIPISKIVIWCLDIRGFLLGPSLIRIALLNRIYLYILLRKILLFKI